MLIDIPQTIERTRIKPLRRRRETSQQPLCCKHGEDILLEHELLFLQAIRKYPLIEEIVTGICQVGRCLFRRGLLHEIPDQPILELDDAKRRRILNFCQGDCRQALLLPMEPKHLLQVDGEQVITVHDEEIIVQELFGLMHPAAGSQRLLLIKIPDLEPELTPITKICLNLLAQIADRQKHLIYANGAQTIDDMLRERLALHIHERLRQGLCQWPQARPETARQNHCLHYAEKETAIYNPFAYHPGAAKGLNTPHHLCIPMINREKVYSVLQMRGPSLPVQIKKALGEGDTFTIGAILTELKEAGKIKVSNTKRGGSPFYYIIEHRHRLVSLIDDLGEKDRRAAKLLQERKVLRDQDEDPLTRVCLRQIKDFSVPVEVKTKDGTQLFWKWFLTSREEAEGLVKNALGIAPEKPPEPMKQENTKAAAPLQQPAPVQQAAPTQQQMPVPTPSQEAPRPAPAPEQEQPKPVPAATVLKQQDDTGDSFLKQLLEYFADKHIQIISKDVLRKNADVEFELSMPTAVGRVDYFCKAKAKKKNNDGDLSSAYVQGQLKKLPVLYITTGDVTKKAKEMLKREFKGMVLVQL